MADPNPDGLDLEAVLESLVSGESAKAAPFALSQIQITRSGDPDTNRMLEIFRQAFPDQDFEAITDEDGRSGIRGTPKPRVPMGESVPSGYSPKLASKGIADIQAAIEAASTDEERFQLATRLNTMVAVHKAFNFNSYKSKAEVEFGVPEIERAIEATRQAELSSPFNPGNGLPSRQRMELITQLGVARTRAGQRIQEFMNTDSSLIQAEALAKGTIAEIEGKIKLEGRTEILEEKRRQKDARAAAIGAMDPVYLNSVSILKRGRPISGPEDALSIGQQLYDGKLRLTESENAIAGASDDTLISAFTTTKDQKQRTNILNVLNAREEAFVGDKALAARNMRAFSSIIDKKLDVDDPNLSNDIKSRLKRINSEITAQAAASGRSKDEMLAASTVGLKRELLSEAIKASLYQNTRDWKGVIAGDEVAQTIFKSVPQGKPMAYREFVNAYLDYNDGRRLADKSKALQAMVTSASESLPKSLVLPIPSAESFALEAQRIIAQAVQRKVWSVQNGRTPMNFMGMPFDI